MTIKAVNQIDVIDLTDGYSVVLTNENYTFLGTTNAVNGTQTTTTKVMALCGSEQVPCKVGTIKWYKNGGTTPVASGQTYSISAGDVDNKATFSAQLEG